MKINFKSITAVLAIAFAALSSSAAITELATFTTDGVNLRKGPSTSNAYLIYQDGEEQYWDASNIGWSDELGSMFINGQRIQPDHSKIQGNSGETYGVLGYEGDWVKLNYMGHDVWTMRKFVKIEPLAPLSTSMTYSPCGYNALNLTDTAEGSPALMYQEAGMDENQGFFIGQVEGNAIVFDYFIPFELVKVPALEDAMFVLGKGDEFNKLRIGNKQLLKGADWGIPDVKTFKPQRIKDMKRAAQKLPEGERVRLYNTSKGALSL